MGGKQQQTDPNTLSQLWNVAPDTSGQLQPADWYPLDPDDPSNYMFSSQAMLGPGNQRANQEGFEILMDDLTRRFQARVDAEGLSASGYAEQDAGIQF